MADLDNGADVSFDIDASEAFQALAESIVRIDRVLAGMQAMSEAIAVSQDLIQREQLTNRVLMKNLLEKYQLQDNKIGALTALLDHHHEVLTKLANLPPRPAGDPLVN